MYDTDMASGDGEKIVSQKKKKLERHRVSILHCLRCEARWIPRKLVAPKTCARCNSPYWNLPRQRDRDVQDLSCSQGVSGDRAVGD